MSLTVDRRGLLRAGGAGLVAVGLASCDLLATDPAAERDDENGSGGANGAKEAPELHSQVAAGELPPLLDRLPEEPMVVEPVDQVGRYGGTLRRSETSMENPRNVYFVGRSSLAEWSLEDIEPVPALAKSWDASADGSVYTFALREGTKWSDGTPFTADDLMFFYEAVLSNEELTPAAPTWLLSGDTPVEFVKVDEFTIELRFAEPNALLLRFLSFASNGLSILTPKHYLEKFHPDYASKAEVDAMVAEAGFESWVDFFLNKNDRWLNPDLPVLGAWKIDQPVEASGTRAVMVRNPYYWKVDTDGNQLPYIDQVIVTGADSETLTLQATNGEIDLQTSYISVNDMPVLSKSEESGGYRLLRWISGSGPYLYTNQCHADLVMRELMQDVRFRQALSHAINRDEMNQVFYGGLGKTVQSVALPEDPYFVEGSGNNFIEYDADQANQLLDELGLDQRDDDGFRLRADGERLRLNISTFAFETGVESVDAYNLVKGYWEEVGIRCTVDNMDGSLWRERMYVGNYDIGGYDMGRYMWDIDPLWYVPTSEATYWAPLFGSWYATRGAEGEEPPAFIRQIQDIYDELKATVDEEQRIALGQEIQSLHDENVWVIGTVTAPFQPVVVSADMINIKEEAVADYRTGLVAITWPEQVSYQNPQDH